MSVVSHAAFPEPLCDSPKIIPSSYNVSGFLSGRGINISYELTKLVSERMIVNPFVVGLLVNFGYDKGLSLFEPYSNVFARIQIPQVPVICAQEKSEFQVVNLSRA